MKSMHAIDRRCPRRIVFVFALVWTVAVLPIQAAHDRLIPIEERHIQVGGEIGRRISITVTNHLLRIDADRDFLRPFQRKESESGYVGLGKLIDAAVRLAAYTGEERVSAFKTRLITEAIRVQEPDGYLGTLRPNQRLWTLWDMHEMAYLIYGLTTDHRFFGEPASLQAAQRLADYLITGWQAAPQRQPGGGIHTVHMAVTGLEPALLALYQQSGDKRYLKFCVEQRRLPEWDGRIVLGRWGQIEGHAYVYLSRCVAQLRLDRLRPDWRLLQPTQQILNFLTEQDGLVISGTCGDHECWHDTQEGTINLGESCATAYLIRFWDELLRRQGQTLYGDLMERAIYNALFGAQSPDGRRIRYYVPFDGPRTYFQGDTYCCPGNYRRIIAELPRMVFYRTANPGLAINLYTSAEATIPLAAGLSVRIRQQTDYPNSGQVKLWLEPSHAARFPLALRIPRWCRAVKLAINGQPLDQPTTPGNWSEVDRLWQAGDRIELELDMPWRLVKGRKAQAGRVAVMRGPLVYGLNRARHSALARVDLRLLVLDPSSLEGPLTDTSVHPGGQACRVRAWGPGQWYPSAQPELALELSEFADPGSEATYFKVPNPNSTNLILDELNLIGKHNLTQPKSQTD